MSTPVTFKEWVKSRSGKMYVGASSIFAFCFSVFQALKLFGVEKIPIPSLPASDEGWLLVNYVMQVIFITCVVLVTAYKFAQIKNAGNAAAKEKAVWINLELHNPALRNNGEELDNGQGEHEEERKESAKEQTKQKAWIDFKLGANKVVRQFTWFWLLAWFSWLFHYGYLLLESLKLVTMDQAFRNFLNNLNSLMFVFLFMTLTVSTSRYGPLFWGKLVFIIFAVFAAEWFAYGSAVNKDMVALSFTVISGLFASIALAAFVGSIDSKFINVPIWIILLLYLYAAIQALYVFFELTHVFLGLSKEQSALHTFTQRTQILITIFAFILKTILFITVTWILRAGRLVYFMIEESSLNFKKDKNFMTFIENIEIEEARLR